MLNKDCLEPRLTVLFKAYLYIWQCNGHLYSRWDLYDITIPSRKRSTQHHIWRCTAIQILLHLWGPPSSVWFHEKQIAFWICRQHDGRICKRRRLKVVSAAKVIEKLQDALCVVLEVVWYKHHVARVMSVQNHLEEKGIQHVRCAQKN